MLDVVKHVSALPTAYGPRAVTQSGYRATSARPLLLNRLSHAVGRDLTQACAVAVVLTVAKQLVADVELDTGAELDVEEADNTVELEITDELEATVELDFSVALDATVDLEPSDDVEAVEELDRFEELVSELLPGPGWMLYPLVTVSDDVRMLDPLDVDVEVEELEEGASVRVRVVEPPYPSFLVV